MTSGGKDIPKPPMPSAPVTAAQVSNGPVMPPQQRLMTYSPDEWEAFVEEWAYYCLNQSYHHVQRFSGSGDMGVDIAGFLDDKRLMGEWDNYQCKHYDHAIRPSDVWVEFGKVIWYSFSGEYTAPRRYFFVAPLGAGTSLSRLLANPAKLRDELIANWEKHVKDAITATEAVPLDVVMRAYVDAEERTLLEASYRRPEAVEGGQRYANDVLRRH